MHLHCTDTGDDVPGEWLLTLTADGPTVEPVHAKGDVAARGTASDLDLYLWGRVDADALEVFGDAPCSTAPRVRAASSATGRSAGWSAGGERLPGGGADRAVGGEALGRSGRRRPPRLVPWPKAPSTGPL